MKRDLKPFLVEVKRGTRRSSFLGQLEQASTMSEAQRRAEATLFTPPVEEAAPKAVSAEPSRRILPSLVEPEVVVASSGYDEAEAIAERRPRPVGRPRKIRPPVSDMPEPPRSKVAAALPPAAPPPLAPFLQPEDANSIAPVPASGASKKPATLDSTTRLRERSSILARYVLGTKPAPGQRWSRTSRRQARASAE